MELKRNKKHLDGIKLKKRVIGNDGEKLSRENIQLEAKQRSKDMSFFQKLLNLFKKEKSYCEIIINGILPEKRVAVLNDGILENIEIESHSAKHTVSAIYKGKIQNLEPGLKAAFVDIGEEKNAFLHYWDILPLVNGEGLNETDHEDGIEVVHRNVHNSKKKLVTLQDIPEMFPVGSELIVQVTKSQIGTKGPRITTNISLPGRYLVLTPYSNQCGISRKIEDQKERDRLKKILKRMTLPPGMGVILRTASAGNSQKQFIRDLQLLLDTWKNVQNMVDKSNHPCQVYQEPNLIERTVRDFLTENVDRVLVDNEADYNKIISIVEKIAPNNQKKIVHFKEAIPIFERFNIEAQLEQTFSRRVPLPSGGEIVIQETEALTAIDVNTSSHKNSDDESVNFILRANLEAAREISRQVKLRNIGGLIIIDFIDMKHNKDRRAIHQFVQNAFSKDKARCHVLPISSLGVMQITRQRHKESSFSRSYSTCPYCNGEGLLKSSHNLTMAIERELLSKILSKDCNSKHFAISLHPQIFSYIRAHAKQDFIKFEEDYTVEIEFIPNDDLHIETFHVKN